MAIFNSYVKLPEGTGKPKPAAIAGGCSRMKPPIRRVIWVMVGTISLNGEILKCNSRAGLAVTTLMQDIAILFWSLLVSIPTIYSNNLVGK